MIDHALWTKDHVDYAYNYYSIFASVLHLRNKYIMYNLVWKCSDAVHICSSELCMSKLLLFFSAYLNNTISFSLFIGLLEIIKHIIQMEHKKVKNLNW